jgi:Outer membrane protein beta-barrel domain
MSLLLAFASVESHAQAIPAAVAKIQLYGWGGFSGNFTGVSLAKNGDITAGVDVEFHPFFTLYPALEVRGSYPIDKGDTVAEKNALIGLRLGRHVHPFSPYGDFLFGRGELNFANGGYPTAPPPPYYYVISNTTNVLSFGGGTDFSLTPRFALKGDFQFQRYATPVGTNGYVYSKVFTLGIVYRIGARGIH